MTACPAFKQFVMVIILNGHKLNTRRIFCVGMNYMDHIKELDSKKPSNPVIFMKPDSCLVAPGKKLRFPSHGSNLHFESELVVLIGKKGRAESKEKALEFIAGLGVGFDLTLRDVQNNLKNAGHPWEVCKAFDDSSPIGGFVPYNKEMNLENIEFSGYVNGHLKQAGNSGQMIYPIRDLIVYLSTIWTLAPGDLIYTGTPPGVGPLKKSDRISLSSPLFSTQKVQEFSWDFQ